MAEHATSARQQFMDERTREQQKCLDRVRLCVAGYESFDALTFEVLSCIGDLYPAEITKLARELNALGIQHCHYQGVLILRSKVEQTGFFFL